MRYPQTINPPEALDEDLRRAPAAEALVEAIALTSEVCGSPLSSAAAELLARDLAGFNEAAVMRALAQCRLELQGALKVADIIVRIEDGRPDVDEAWATMPRSEAASVVWTDEMAQAWGAALPLLQAGEVAAAKHAFRDAYLKSIVQARLARKTVRWTPSLGSDAASRESVLLEAVQKKRLSAAHVAQLLPQGAISAELKERIAQLNLKKLH